MFHIIDKYRIPAQIVLGLIGISFMAFGVSSFQVTPDNNYIVQIGDERITRYQLDQAMQNTEASGAMADRQAVFNTLMQQAYLLEGAKKMGLVVSDEQIKQMVVNAPQFHDANGKFDVSLFKNYLEQAHLNEQTFMDNERRRLTVALLLQTLGSGVAADVQAAQLLNATLATRTIRSAHIDTTGFVDKVKVDEADLKKFYEANQKKYILQQGIKFEYVIVSPNDLMDKQNVSDEEIEKAFNETKSNIKPKRKLAHILISAPKSADASVREKAKAEAEKIAAEVKAAPQKFAELAKKYSQDESSAAKGGELGEFTQNGTLGSKSLEDAAFALNEGEISGVVESDFGYHIIRASDIQSVDLKSQKENIIQILRQKKAQQAYIKLRDEMNDLTLATPNELKSAANKLGLTVHTQNEWTTRANADGLKIPKAVVEQLFSDDVFKKKHNSEAINVDGVTWFVRATETREESVEPFDQIKERVKEDYVQSEGLRLAREFAQNLVNDLQAGKQVTIEWTEPQEIVPAAMRSVLPENTYLSLMKAIPKDGKSAFVVLDLPDATEIVEVQKITANHDTDMLENAKAILVQNNANSLAEAYIDSLRSQISTKQGAEKVSD